MTRTYLEDASVELRRESKRERERRFRVNKAAPGFHPAPREGETLPRE